MVSELFRKGMIVYLCDVCGFGYADMNTAERCEQLGYSNNESTIQKRAIYKPKVKVLC